MDQARDYQANSIISIRECFLSGFMKVLLWLATGGGKTWVFCRMIKDAHSRGKTAIVIVRGRKLVDQASKRLAREGVPHGVLMAKHWNYRPTLPVQVCSIDTLIARKIFPPADLIVIDEAHLATSDGYKEFLKHYPKAYVVAVTATPYPEKGNLRHVADTIVKPTSMQGLIDDGYLVRFRYFGSEAPDLSEVKVSSTTKDYVSEDLENVMSEAKLTGNIVQHWIDVAYNLPTICFAVNITHSMLLVQRFKERGIAAEHCDADTSDAEREEIIKRVEQGITKIIVNVGIMCTGVDIPCLGAVILARPTKSLNLYIQQAGRGTRPVYEDGFDLSTREGRLSAIAASFKPNCILLDHAGNIEEHGLPTDEPDVDLDGKKKRSISRESKMCKNCFAIYRAPLCPECGIAPLERDTEVNLAESNGKLVELKDIEIDPIKRALKEYKKEASDRKRKPAWVYHKMVDKFGFEKAKPYLPAYFIEKYETSREAEAIFSNSRFKGFGDF